MKKGKWTLAAAALVMAGSLTVSPALAFFTANTEAYGVRGIRFGVDTELEEDIIGGEKLVTVKNTGKSPCWVRARVFYGESSVDGLAPKVTVKTEGTRWAEGTDGWYYYTELLAAPEDDGEEIRTDKLTAAFTAPDKELTADYDIIVIYEYMPYMGEEDSDGVTAYQKVNWKLEADTNRTEAGTITEGGTDTAAIE